MARKRVHIDRSNFDYQLIEAGMNFLNDPHQYKTPLNHFLSQYHLLSRYPSKLLPHLQLEEFHKKRLVTNEVPFQIMLEEPFEVYYDLSTRELFSDKHSILKKRELDEEIRILKSQLGNLTELPNRIRIRRRLFIHNKPKKQRQYRNTIYSLWRLIIAKKVVNKLNIDIEVSIADVLALWATEGDLNIPFSLLAIYLEIEPNALTFFKKGKIEEYVPEGAVPKWYHSKNQTFHVEKKDSKEKLPREQQVFKSEVKSALKSRKFILENAKKEISYLVTPISVLQNSKENAVQLYLFSLIGLDFYARTTFSSLDIKKIRKRNFCYQYARYRIKAGIGKDFKILYKEGEIVYERMTNVTLTDFYAGRLFSDSIVCLIYPKTDELHHHLIPVEPIEFSVHFIEEGLVRFEALKRDGLIFGSKRFDSVNNNILPSTIAYIRYNLWEANFLLIVLDVVHQIIHHRGINSRSPAFLWKIKSDLSSFHSSKNEANKEMWKFVKNKLEKHLKNTKIKVGILESSISDRQLLRQAISLDASNLETYQLENPGETEKTYINSIKTEGKLDRYIKVIDAMTVKILWDEFEQALFNKKARKYIKWFYHKSYFISGGNVFRFRNNFEVFKNNLP